MDYLLKFFVNKEFAYFIIVLVLTFMAAAVFYFSFTISSKVIANRAKKEELGKINDAFEDMVGSDGYQYLADLGTLKGRFALWKNAPVTNKVITRKNGDREFYLLDLVVQEEHIPEGEAGASGKVGKSKVDRYFTYMIANLDYQLQGSIQLKPRHSMEGYVSDVPYQEGDSFPEAIPNFTKRYMIRFNDMTSEIARYVLTPDVQKNLITRAVTYPVNSDIRWITIANNTVEIECCRIRNSEELKKLVAFSDQFIDRLKGIKATTEEGIVEEKPVVKKVDDTPVAETKPVSEEKPVSDEKSVTEEKPVTNDKPAVEEKPAQETDESATGTTG